MSCTTGLVPLRPVFAGTKLTISILAEMEKSRKPKTRKPKTQGVTRFQQSAVKTLISIEFVAVFIFIMNR